MSNIVPFQFETKNIRTIIDERGDTWFVLRDVLGAMGTATPTTAAVESIISGLGEGYSKILPLTDNLGRNQQNTIFVAEKAVFHLLGRSSKPSVIALHAHITDKLLQQRQERDLILDALYNFEVPADLPEMYIYAIREQRTGNIKLGISRDPQQRLLQLQTGNSSELELVAYRKASNRFFDERRLHQQAQDRHVRGEWFLPAAADLLVV